MVSRPHGQRAAEPHIAYGPADAEGDVRRGGLAAHDPVLRIGDPHRRAGGGEGARLVRVEADAQGLAAEIDQGVAAAPAAEQAAFILQRQGDGALAWQRRTQHEADHLLGHAAGSDHAVCALQIGAPGPADPALARPAARADRDPPDGGEARHLLGADHEAEGEGARAQPRLAGREGGGEHRQGGRGRIDPDPPRRIVQGHGDDAVAAHHPFVGLTLLARGGDGGNEGKAKQRDFVETHTDLPNPLRRPRWRAIAADMGPVQRGVPRVWR